MGAAAVAKLQAESGGINLSVYGREKKIPVAHKYKHVASISRSDLKA